MHILYQIYHRIKIYILPQLSSNCLLQDLKIIKGRNSVRPFPILKNIQKLKQELENKLILRVGRPLKMMINKYLVDSECSIDDTKDEMIFDIHNSIQNMDDY